MKTVPALAWLLAVATTPFPPPAYAAPATLTERTSGDLRTLETAYARLKLDDKGFVVSLVATATGKEYVPAGRPSPLLGLHEGGAPNDKLSAPVSAVFRPEKGEIALTYANGAIATIKAAAKDGYFRFRLVSLEPRGKVDNVVWGPLDTTISGKIGDIIGVVRDPDFAIGMQGLDDNTIPGPVEDSDCFGMGYYIHSPDPKKYPVPEKYKEGQWFNIGGDGISDTAFFSRPEQYFQWVSGSGAKLRPEFGSTIVQHSRDRRKSYVHFYSLLPGFKDSRPRHMVSDPVPGVDFIGSGVALYACPDSQGLATLEKIFKGEGLPYITHRDGKWVRDPRAPLPSVWWGGPMDKAVEYTKALGFRSISRDTGGFYPSLDDKWGGRVGFSGSKTMTYKEFGEACNRRGVIHGGLHTLCLFLKGVPKTNPLTVCRVKLAKDVPVGSTEIVVDDKSFLDEFGTWPSWYDNYARIGTETITFKGISETPPWTLTGVKRTKAEAHKAGDELAKLMQNCYHGFLPDMKLMLDYADYYADLMVRNGMDTINFDGYECLMYTNHGYYAMRAFNRRLFETYHKLTGGKWPLITGSNVFAGAWEYMNVCDIGSGSHMFDPRSGMLGIEGKDICRAFDNSWFPGTFGVQDWNAGWNLFEAEVIQAKAVGWNATYNLNLSQAAVEATAEWDAIAKAFRAWNAAREANVFTEAQKERLRDPAIKFHLERTGDRTFILSEIKAKSIGAQANDKENPANPFKNTGAAQPLDFVFRLGEPHSRPVSVESLTMTLPDGTRLTLDRQFSGGETIICRDGKAWLVDAKRKRTGIPLERTPMLPAGDARFLLKTTGSSRPDSTSGIWTIYTRQNSETVGR